MSNTHWTTLSWGKHEGKSLPQILFSDPDWFFFTFEEKRFEGKGKVKLEAQAIYERATVIKIPDNDSEDLMVEYFIHPPTGKFSHFEIVKSQQALHEGSSFAFRSNYIDMRVPKKIAEYDKLGYKTFIKCLKECLFGSSNVRLTKEKCETFFSDLGNFDTE
jgi:hypothetical protein